MTLGELISVICGSCRVIIRRNDAEIWSGYVAALALEDNAEMERAEVKKLTFYPDIKHKRWQELGLLEPMHKEETPAYSFSDLELRLFYIIDIR